ncbi:General secretion pathway protein K [Rubripirellula lacrimiformis]|uniref:General secretion pathway protein K n=1 Tax=Rubripirellula lacrimiformis TaxID=1930273 RepID=A0A517N8E4_9BACT|nr:type II secretion system protein GspK [Rubripirellula lacrimiformis]QDT03268.1 General secretion pathway protein K [Rubripirellula lacrimiformis]
MAHRRHPRGGFFLVLVLIVVAVATMAVYSFTELMLAYDDSAYLAGDLVQARVNVESATESMRLILSQPPETRIDFGGLYNNPQLFQAITVSGGDDGSPISNFSILAPDLTETGTLGGLRFGLQNESARLNINALIVLEANGGALMPVIAAAGADAGGDAVDDIDTDNIAVSLLMSLPGMTEDVADAILDWIDEDDEPRPFGAESDYYQTLPAAYSAANGPLNSVEELLLVRGVTPTLLFGADANRNGVMDPDEQQRFGVSIDTAGVLGWAAYMTVHGAEANKRRDGSPRVNVNQDDLEVLYTELLDAIGDESYASFIVAYRIAGESTSLTSALAGAADGGNNGGQNQDDEAQPGGPWSADLFEQLDLTGGGGTKLTQILDLVDAKATVGQGGQARSYDSPFASDPISASVTMPILMDALTTQDVDVMPGRINVNECPAELLYGIPLLSEEAVQAILETRQPESDDPNRNFETWLMVEGLLTLDEMRQVTPLLTAGGDVYRAQVVGYFEQAGASARVEVLLDATTVNPKVISWRDLSHLGRGFDLSVLGLRSGVVQQ